MPAGTSTEADPRGELPELDDVLAAALEAQGEPGKRALGLLRDARRALAGAGMVRPAEVAAACVRSAADTLLKLPGVPKTSGLQDAARDLLTAVDTSGSPPGGSRTSGGRRASAGGPG
ncbi:hypothetical protein [Streptomyces sp. NPDC056308]|uniref:hypothetical protein n=1 Tax=Streptomyces sp. NPDC056308 TaxID=3345780 RepID=UPI0035E265D7